MSSIDLIVLVCTLAGIICYGLYKSKSTQDLDGYFRSNRNMPWYLVLLGIMGTQASAITFLSAPGQAYSDGMRFLQYYFGLPLAMIVVAAFFVPVYRRLNVYSAYELIGQRFNRSTRTLTAFLFLLSRGLSTGISIYAPSIILSTLLGWNIYLTNVLLGGFLIIYTLAGGARAVAHTQKLQFLIIAVGLMAAGISMVRALPDALGFQDALAIGGKLGRLNIITTGFTDKGFNWNDKYNLFSGIIGGFFLALSYFGTDQSQVGRYLTAKSENQSRLGLLLNGLVKIPMQFAILLLGVLLLAFYQFHQSPVYFNNVSLEKLSQNPQYSDSVHIANELFFTTQAQKEALVQDLPQMQARHREAVYSQLAALQHTQDSLRQIISGWVKQSGAGLDASDNNYIFMRFTLQHLPTGLIGLIIAIIFLSAWGSIAAALNSLASSTMVDLHLVFGKGSLSDIVKWRWSMLYTLSWGIFCIVVACISHNLGNSLIEAVNILGSLFYGTILGIFMVALFMPAIKGNGVLIPALLAQILVLMLFVYSELSFLWFNAIGCLVLIVLACVQYFLRKI